MRSAILGLCLYLSSVAPASTMYVWEDGEGVRHISTHPRNCVHPDGILRTSSECLAIDGMERDRGRMVGVQNGRSKWSYREIPDKMRGGITKSASVLSNNEASFSFPYQGGSRMSLVLRESARSGVDVILTITPGQFVCLLDCSVHIRFDAGNLETVRVSKTSDGSAQSLFIDGYSRFIGKLQNAKKLMVEAEFYREGATQFEFNVAGLTWR